MIKVEANDRIFADSPDAGWPECICSRCGKMITEDEIPLRLWTTNNDGEMDENSMEYRYCNRCQERSGIKIINDDGIWLD